MLAVYENNSEGSELETHPYQAPILLTSYCIVP